jgi:hypothetical protein
MQPDFKALAERGRLMFCDLREADDAAHNRRIATAGLPHPSPLQARLAAAMRVPPSQGMLQDEAHCEALGHAFRSARGTPTRVARQSQAGNTAADWGEIIAALNPGAARSRSATSPTDPNLGWSSIISQVEREQTQSNSVSSGASSKADRDWTEIIRGMNAKVGASA